MRLHPATQILIWCVLVAVMQFLAPMRLLFAGGLILFIAFVLSRHKLVQLVRRTRWIMVSLWLIYAYTAPDRTEFSFYPSTEGLLEGGLQLMRLLASLAALAILLDRLHRPQLIAGLYSLFTPLQWLGLSRERIAVRLALTLHYAEIAMLRPMPWQAHLDSLFEPCEKSANTMELPVYHFAMIDALLLGGAALLFWRVLA